MTIRATTILALLLLLGGRATAKPPRPAAFDPSVYPAPAKLPAGLSPMTAEDRGGRRWWCAGPAACAPEPETFAGWFGTVGPRKLQVRIEVQALAPVQAPSDEAWARKARAATHDVEKTPLSFHDSAGTLHVWRGAHGRIAQSETQYVDAKMQTTCKLSRHEERDGWLLHLEIRASGASVDDATRDQLRAAFADGALGAAPTTAKVIKGL